MYKVYLVDDDVYVRKGIKTLIDWETYGFSICGEADNGEDALADIKQLQPELILTDIRMPVLDGLDLIKCTKESLTYSPYFIVISGYTDFKYAQRALRYGVKDFILKPVDQEEIHQTLDRVANAIQKDSESRHIQDKIEVMTEVKKILFDESCNKNKNYHHPFFSGETYTFVKAEFNSMDIDYQSCFTAIEKELLTLKGQEHYVWFEDNVNCFGLVINNHFLKANNLTFRQFLTQQYNIYTTQLNLDINLYSGNTVDGIESISMSYKAAKKCVQFKYLFNKQIITNEMIEDKDVYFIDLDQSYYDDMLEFIEENNQKKIEEQLVKMIETCQEMNFAKDAFRTVINRLNHKILKSIKEVDGNEQEISTLKEMLEWEEFSLTLDQLTDLWLQFIKEATMLLANLNQNNMKGTIYQIKKYIHSHFDQPITLKSIANKFYMNPVYMGQLFKKTYGIYFKDYILSVRMDEAKKLLRKTDLKVYEVAEKVGFTNPDYFVTQFEKNVGTTPSQYRKKLMEQIS
ncbi:response regulator transcription factor [Gracilibacillus kekensis]|uniref:Two-component system, response regulator YesN n=1 Tax=Gracilibacillus kekensis TaxID=1027249 RepID=A0A1M7N5W1_9BACI|nr:response regulator [Gracilibacillus kekensis]SHM98955.1 two-component system, response regulator YesN [Gracilibacillus kekensis]